jgi:putative endonuclease
MKSQKRSFYKGVWAEILALWYLRLKGYQLLKHRWKTPVGEIDLLMKKGNSLIIIEVKYRPTYAQAVESISPAQQRRLYQAGRIVQQHYGNEKTTIRFDAFIVYKGKWPQRLVDCWRNMSHKGG